MYNSSSTDYLQDLLVISKLDATSSIQGSWARTSVNFMGVAVGDPSLTFAGYGVAFGHPRPVNLA